MLERSLGVVLHQLRYNDESVIVNISGDIYTFLFIMLTII